MILLGNLALILWPIITIVLFRRRPPAEALCWAIIAGYLLLPTDLGMNLPALPTLDKFSIPSFAALAMTFIVLRRAGMAESAMVLPGWIPKTTWVRLMLLAIPIGAFGTMYFNTSGYSSGARSMPGLSLYDAFSMVLVAFTMLVPMFLGRKLLAHPQHHLTLLTILGISALIYSIPTLYEVRMSPQLNRIVYGFFAHDWRQVVRSGGFRPMVFLQHGLLLAIFFSCATIAIAGLLRADPDNKRRNICFMALGWLALVMVLSKSLGALIITICLVPIVLFLRVHTQLIIAAILSGIVLFYPLLRTYDWIPVDRIENMAAKIDTGRAASLGYRFDNEDILLEKAREKPLFGWGIWGRSRVFDERGRDISTTDGHWVIILGIGGLTRYLAEYGLMTAPIILLFLRRRRYEVSLATSGLCLVLTANLIDTIPNAGLTPLTWLMAGALIGRVELGRVSESASEPADTSDTTRSWRYARPHKPPPPRKRPKPMTDAKPQKTRRSFSESRNIRADGEA